MIRGGPGDHRGPHVFVGDVDAPDPDAHDRTHLERSLRLKSGDALTVSDGLGRWARCTYRSGPLEIVAPGAPIPRPTPELTVAFALTKGTKPELAVQKLTEVGVDVIVPFVAERSIARWDSAKASRMGERLRRISREAAMQAHRAWLPVVGELSTFAEVAELGTAVRGDRGGSELGAATNAVLIGPEGGWSDAEAQRLPAVDLGPNVLRAETAAIAAGVLLVSAHRR